MARRVAITGARGQLGMQLVRAFSQGGDEVLPLARPDFDITSADDLARLIAWRPDLVINSAAWTDVDGCARDPDRAFRINGDAAGAVAEAAERAGALIVQISTNEVFDGELDRPYTEEDEPKPINPYGASKLAGERLVASSNPRHLIIRTAWLFGPGGNNFVTKILAAAERARAAGEPLQVVDDEWGNPTWTPWLAGAVRSATTSSVGVLHLAGEPATTRLGWARAALSGTGVGLTPIRLREFQRASRVPARAVLSTSLAGNRGLSAGDWRAPTGDFVHSTSVAS